MLDSDLAELYGVSTGTLNQAVQRNIDRFPPDFMFQVTDDELDALKSQIVTSKDAQACLKSQSVIAKNAESDLRCQSSISKGTPTDDIRSQIVTLKGSDQNLKSQIVTSSLAHAC